MEEDVRLCLNRRLKGSPTLSPMSKYTTKPSQVEDLLVGIADALGRPTHFNGWADLSGFRDEKPNGASARNNHLACSSSKSSTLLE